ncbi:MAG: imidazole glycerol phosphate synthase subunit HisF [Rubricoccaceae bacterium]|nr:imidazole glycerol phosphate synthase subunit HisF [Rubricoccaceae bacterium]
MLARRIIPCLDVRDGRTVKGVNFVGFRDAGDPVELAARYAAEGADELVFLDVTATVETRATARDLALRVGRVLDVPFTIGGGIGSVEDAAAVLDAGADKVGVNSAAVRRPALLAELAEAFGRQAVVLSVDAKRVGEGWTVRTHGGRTDTGLDAIEWIAEGQRRGAGEVLLTSVDADGTQAGFDLPLLRAARAVCRVPLIASGGAGAPEHFADALAVADAALAASLFHYGTLAIPDLKQALAEAAIPVRLC